MTDQGFQSLLCCLALSIGLLFGLPGIAPLAMPESRPEAAEGSLDDASAALESSESPAQAPDATREHLTRQIEEAQQQLLRAREDLARLQQQQARTEQELEKQQEEERRLQANIRRYEDRIRRGQREYDIYEYNLSTRFPRERQRLLTEQQSNEAERTRLDTLLADLIRGGLSGPAATESRAVRPRLLGRAVLHRTLPSILQRKQVLLERSDEIRRRLQEIERLTELDRRWIESAQRRLESHDERHSNEARRLEESARKQREAREEFERIQQRIESLNALVAEIQQRLPLLQEGIDYKSFVEQRGELFWPIAGSVVHGYGPRKHPQFDLVFNNPGIDIAAAPGEEIRAVAGGWVVYTGTLPGYGSLVMVHHGAGYFSFYTPAVPVEGIEAGPNRETRVEPGQVIAVLGGSPSVEEGLLHVEIRHGETALNPLEWLRRQSGESAGDASGLSKE